MSEFWDVYDQNRELTGKMIQRGEVFADGEFYVCCEVWIMNSKKHTPTNSIPTYWMESHNSFQECRMLIPKRMILRS